VVLYLNKYFVGRIQKMRRILTMKRMLRIGRIRRMRGDTKDGENIQGRILRMG
jgi:hypothetical protein